MENYCSSNFTGQQGNLSGCGYHHPCGFSQPSIYLPSMEYTVSVPINLAKSLEGKYFVGYADNLTFGKGTSAWARLYNPPNSGVNLHVTV